ncbi:MAG: bifunctional ornithine acetyltransferase/N-acetylglutamate synthase [Sporolactobacillus sp.]
MKSVDSGCETISVLPGGSVGSPKGFMSGGRNIGLRKQRPDLGWIVSEIPAAAAGVYTTNRFQAAPLQVTKATIKSGHCLQAIVANSVNANSCTGDPGLENAHRIQTLAAQKFGIPAEHVGIASTGVIGVQLPMDVMSQGIEAVNVLHEEGSFEQAIMTTDTKEKHLAVQFSVDGKEVTVGGACKGSGMIHPNMATMLGFVTTDAAVEAGALQQALSDVTDRTFNRITVDGDTSTNDMVIAMANGMAENDQLTPEHPQWPVFIAALETVCRGLAKKIAADGEGATKLIEVRVSGAADQLSAEKVSKAIVGSSLVKTAVFGSDANWGRIVCAIGYSGVAFDPSHVSAKLGTQLLFQDGLPVPFDEQIAKAELDGDNIVISVSLGEGSGSAVAWGCDLTYNYVKINTSYRS